MNKLNSYIWFLCYYNLQLTRFHALGFRTQELRMSFEVCNQTFSNPLLATILSSIRTWQYVLMIKTCQFLYIVLESKLPHCNVCNQCIVTAREETYFSKNFMYNYSCLFGYYVTVELHPINYLTSYAQFYANLQSFACNFCTNLRLARLVRSDWSDNAVVMYLDYLCQL